MIGPEQVDEFLDLVTGVVAASLGFGALLVAGAVLLAVVRVRRLPRVHAAESSTEPH
ncbi:hypothetical protein AB0B28_20215 [Glycomyces sp. NPDC046736]|uniref:hypothetical protein n=1 Tax=Glycomyces sp. NPDC046736 TaxID=3155615 RepID=UPI0033F945B5